VVRDQPAGVEQVAAVRACVVDGVLSQAAAAEVAGDHHLFPVDRHILDAAHRERRKAARSVEVDDQRLAVGAALDGDARRARGRARGHGDLEHVQAFAGVHQSRRIRRPERERHLARRRVPDDR
jgi:hypothetical protein